MAWHRPEKKREPQAAADIKILDASKRLSVQRATAEEGTQ